MIVNGVHFEELGPVDRRRSAEVRGSYVFCPYCDEGQIHPPKALASHMDGPWICADERANSIVEKRRIRAVRYFFEHLKADHFRCLDCGWVGTRPRAHVTRSPNHDGPLPVAPGTSRRVRIAEMIL